MESKIKPGKIDAGESYEIHPRNDAIEAMELEVSNLCDELKVSKKDFKKDKVLDTLAKFVVDDKRMLYSQVTTYIFNYYDKKKPLDPSSDLTDNMLSNLVTMLDWIESEEFKNNSTYLSRLAGDPSKIISLRKIVIKLWDHINLANHQYNQLKESDEEFDKKFVKRFRSAANESLNEFSKEMNTQLLTLVGIFTALAFMVFGSITGLSNLITNIKQPVPRLIILGCVWGIAVLNLVFVFLFCVGKMTKANFASTDNPTASIWEKYPIVWWSDFAIGSILVLSSWLYYLKNRHGLAVLDKLLVKHPAVVFYGGSAIIIAVIMIVFLILRWATGVKKNSKNLS